MTPPTPIRRTSARRADWRRVGAVAVALTVVLTVTIAAAAAPTQDDPGPAEDAAPAVATTPAASEAEIESLLVAARAAEAERLETFYAAAAKAEAERRQQFYEAVARAEAERAAAERAAAERAAAERAAARSSSLGGGFAALRNCESGGDYSAVSSSGTYRGAYQFSRSTWNSVASSNHPHLVGVDPASASPADQDAMAQALYRSSGSSPWPHCGRNL